MDIKDIVKKFEINGEPIKIEPYGNGHINTTFLIECDNNGMICRYILQKINTTVFTNVEGLMSNILGVTSFLKERIIANGGNPDIETLNLVLTNDGKSYFECKDGAYRIYKFIENTIALQIAEDKEVFEGAGYAFGNFVKMLNDYDASGLFEVIQNFHNTQSRFQKFINAVDEDIVKRADSVREEIDFVLKRSAMCDNIVTLLESKTLPLRVTHNDTKLNNVLISEETGKPVCVIDLDTIMPGSLLYDFGDAIRSGCNTGLEDEPDLTKVGFDIDLFESFTKGFMTGIGNCITPLERDLLSLGAIMMTFECGMRFLTDYLEGDTYFKIHYPEHNLVRCHTQFKMVSDMENLRDKMDEIARKYSKV